MKQDEYWIKMQLILDYYTNYIYELRKKLKEKNLSTRKLYLALLEYDNLLVKTQEAINERNRKETILNMAKLSLKYIELQALSGGI